MAKMGSRKHLKRYKAPKTWPIHPKEDTWTVKPSAGSHAIVDAIPLTLVIRDILKLADNLKIVGNVFSWDEVENAEAYEVYLEETKLATVETTSYTLTTAALVDITKYSPEVLTVRAITTAEGYYAHGNAACSSSEEDITFGEELQTNNPKFDNFTPVDLRFNRTAGWDFYPYGNWSDMNAGVGGHYYIQSQADGNTCLKVPAVVWAPGNTTVKKDLSGNTALPGTYEISFDLMASEQALTLNNGNGGYGALHVYMWTNAEGFDHAIPATFNVSSVVKDLANKTTWSNVRARYTVPEGTAATFNQFNMIYWPEGSVGEDNYILIDNIEIYKVVEDVVVEDNIDTIMGGDLEMFTMPNAGTTYHGNILVEPSSRGSSIVHENDNQYLKLVSGDHHPTSDITIFSNGALNQAGMYYLRVDVKIGEDADLNTPLRVKVWSFINGGVNALVDDVQLRPMGEPSKDEFVTYGALIVSKGAANDWANLFFMAELHNDVNRSMDNCLFLDNISIVSVSVG